MVATAAAEDLLVTQYKNDPSGAPYGVAIEKGFFRKAGVDVTGVISGEGGGSSVRAVIASSLGFGETSPAAAIAAISQGQDLRIVDIGSRSLADNVIIVMPGSPIKSVKDLKGKKFAISNPKSLGEMTIVAAGEQVGMNPADIQRVALGNLSGALTALENHMVDATTISGVLFMMRGGESSTTSSWGRADALAAARSRHRDHRPDEESSRRVARAVARRAARSGEVHRSAHRRRRRDPGEGLRSVTAQGRQHHDAPACRREILREGRIEMPLLQTTAHVMRAVGMLDKDVDLSKMVDPSFLPADLQK